MSGPDFALIVMVLLVPFVLVVGHNHYCGRCPECETMFMLSREIDTRANWSRGEVIHYHKAICIKGHKSGIGDIRTIPIL